MIKHKMLLAAVIALTLMAAPGSAPAQAQEPQPAADPRICEPLDPMPGLALKKAVILSRHNIRAPLTGNGSTLERITAHKWIAWSGGPSELSLRGGELETMAGQYFRKYLVSRGLMEENEIPAEGRMRFYANSMQRTIATAQYFSSGMLPVANVKIEHHYELNKMDPVFKPQITNLTAKLSANVQKEIIKNSGGKSINAYAEQLQPNLSLMEKVLDLPESPIAKEEGFKHFAADDLKVHLEEGKEPYMTGSLKKANTASDALILQYYESDSAKDAAWGKELTDEEWQSLAQIKDVYGDILFSAPSAAANVANPLLKEIRSEINNDKRVFTFLCGHDSNISSVTAALKMSDYLLPYAVERRTPIGSKLLFQIWEDGAGKRYVTAHLVYETAQQLRSRSRLDLAHPPVFYEMEFENMKKAENGAYHLEDVKKRFDEAIEAYDKCR